MYGVTHLIMGAPILGRVRYVQNSLSDKVSVAGWGGSKIVQEDVNGEKLTMKKWWIFGADFSRFTQSFSRFIRDINGEKTSRY